MKEVTITYDDVTVRRFLLASVVWGLVGMLVGVLIASQLAFHQLTWRRGSALVACVRCTPTRSSLPSSAI